MTPTGGSMIQRTHFGDADIRTRHLFLKPDRYEQDHT
nr:MAG TPA_asm: hypothetical protein [Caudoviricetes sp.]